MAHEPTGEEKWFSIRIEALAHVLRAFLITSSVFVLSLVKVLFTESNLLGLLYFSAWVIYTMYGYWTFFCIYHKDYFYSHVILPRKSDEPLVLRRLLIAKCGFLFAQVLFLAALPHFVPDHKHNEVGFLLFAIVGFLDICWLNKYCELTNIPLDINSTDFDLWIISLSAVLWIVFGESRPAPGSVDYCCAIMWQSLYFLPVYCAFQDKWCNQ